MKTEDLIDAISMVDDSLLMATENGRQSHKKPWLAVAAMLCVVLGLVAVLNDLSAPTIVLKPSLFFDDNAILADQMQQSIENFCKDNDLSFGAYPCSDQSILAHASIMEQAIADGCNVLVLPSYRYVTTLSSIITDNPSVYFIALNTANSALPSDFVPPENLVCLSFDAAQLGYLVGYAAAAEGYQRLGCAAEPDSAYAYGFVQGAYAAMEEISLWVCQDRRIPEKAYEIWYEDTDLICTTNAMQPYVQTAAAASGKKYFTANMTQTNASLLSSVDIRFDRILNDILDACQSSNQKYSGFVTLSLADGDYLEISDKFWNFSRFTRADYEKVLADIRNGCVRQVGSFDELGIAVEQKKLFD